MISLYLWIKALHIMAVIAWMAGLFYLPRLFVYHAENGEDPSVYRLLNTMEGKLLTVIMTPAMVVTWAAGLFLVMTPGVVDWSLFWPWSKLVGVVAMTAFHFWLASQRQAFLRGATSLTGRQYRMINEVPTLLMIVIVLSVVLKF
ncbi:protoporphyrinogen oxidase HemJ [Roseicitreum antarcticum]|uniref:Protoporphyrinogen IX oxidase n=1 Tax=Roseicitreum antarcticum TaxID=564137 RepID=A0A1H2QZR6_9RHOB|nr:protoporphyrinogen oxidase HemJ [Roseicitreum antarcticum]SDW12370.1 putative membrane protein [Roseicitreum antarcticum]